MRLDMLGLIAILVSVLLTLPVARSEGAEVGLDMGLGLRLDRDRNVTFGFPGPLSATDPVVPVVRVGFPLSDYDQIEIAPGLTYTSSSDVVFINTSLSLAVSYLRGNTRGGHPSPYVRVGGNWRRDSIKNPYSDSFQQLGGSAGGGLKWRLGKAFALRTEGLFIGWFTGRMPHGWDFVARVGFSAFTD